MAWQLLLAVLLVAGVRAEGDVVDLTDDAFDAFVKSKPFALVEFFAPWFSLVNPSHRKVRSLQVSCA